MRYRFKPLTPICLAIVATSSFAHESPWDFFLSHAHGQTSTQGSGIAQGVVFEDRNRDGERDRSERGIGGVSVSNGVDVVVTDNQGRYAIDLPAKRILFISKPAGYDLPIDAHQLPQFYYVHYPNGTPPVADFEFPVIEPTGPLPAAINFALLPEKMPSIQLRRVARLLPDEISDFLEQGRSVWDGRYQTDRFRAMVFADTQTSSDEEVDMLREDIVDELTGNPFGARFGLVAGDVVDDLLSLYPRHNGVMAKIGIPMFNLPGNHDMNLRSPDDRYATQTFKRVFGPTYYSFNYGNAHFVALDNVDYKGDGQGDFDNTSYRGFISEQQLAWLRNDLQHVSRENLLVIATHIPLVTYALDGQDQRYEMGDNINTVNLDALLKIIEPFPSIYAMAGHDTSNSWKVEVDHRHNWRGYPFVAHTLAEARGNDWSAGPRDERGVRSATMQDGNPNGYYVVTFDGTDVKPKFVPASSNPDYAMRIVLDPQLQGAGDFDADPVAINRGELTPGTKIVVNLFDGGERDRVELSLDGQPFVQLMAVLQTDPFMERQFARYADSDDAFSEPVPSSHIWEYDLLGLDTGVHTVWVRSEDEFGQRASRRFNFEVVEE